MSNTQDQGGSSTSSILPSPPTSRFDPNTLGIAQQLAGSLGLTVPSQDQANSSQFANILGAGASSTINGNSKIFWGYSGGNASLHGIPQAQMTTLQDALSEFYKYSPKQVSALAQKLVSAGVLNPQNANDPSAVEQAYTQVLQQLAKMTSANNYVSLDDYLNHYMKGAGAARPSSYTTTETSTNLTDPQSARQLLIQTLQNSLGRNPSAAEYQAFLASIHAAERQNPTVTSRTMKFNNATQSYDVANTTTSGGVDPTSFASDYGTNHNQSEHGAYQAATTYFDALKQAVGAVV